MSDLQDLIPLSEARTLVPGCPHLTTLRRWYGPGVRGRRLPTVLRGGRRYVHPQALASFIRAEPVDAEVASCR